MNSGYSQLCVILSVAEIATRGADLPAGEPILEQSGSDKEMEMEDTEVLEPAAPGAASQDGGSSPGCHHASR